MKKRIILGKAFLLLSILWLNVSEAYGQNDQKQHIRSYYSVANTSRRMMTQEPRSQFIQLIQNFNEFTAQDYLFSLVLRSLPYFAIAGVTIKVFIKFLRKPLSNFQNDKNLGCLVTTYLIIAFIVFLVSLGICLQNKKLQNQFRFSIYDAQNIKYYQTYLLKDQIKQFSASIQNSIPYLINYFSSNNFDYNKIIDTSLGSAHSNSQVFNCRNSNITVQCPFPDEKCTTPYLVTFNTRFCDSSCNGTAANLIANQMLINSTTWRNNILNITQTLSSLYIDASSIQTLQKFILDYADIVEQYFKNFPSQQLQRINVFQRELLQPTYYKFYGIISGITLISIISLCMVYCCRAFKYNCFYLYWLIFFISSFLLFINGGLLNSAYILVSDICSGYSYYFKNQNNFDRLNLGSQYITNTLRTCLFKNKQFFQEYANKSIITQFSLLYSVYQQPVLSKQFKSIVKTIQNQLHRYLIDPQTIEVENVGQQAYIALLRLNYLANYSLPDSTQTCNLTRDYFTFNISECELYLTNQPVGKDCCILLNSPNITEIINERVNAFKNKSCMQDANNYQNQANALISFMRSIGKIVEQLAPVTGQNTSLQNYQSAYYNYYQHVLNFYNQHIIQVFNTTLNSYLKLTYRSGCQIKGKITSLYYQINNQLKFQLQLFSYVNDFCSAMVFLLFILTYYLIIKLQVNQSANENDSDNDNHPSRNRNRNRHRTQVVADEQPFQNLDTETTSNNQIQLLQMPLMKRIRKLQESQINLMH